MNSESASVIASEREDADRVGHGDDQAEVEGMARGAARSDEVGGHDRLAVPRGQRMRGAPEHGDEQRHEDDADREALAADERREAVLGVLRDAYGRRELAVAGELRRRARDRARGDPGGCLPDVERALEQVLGIGAQLVGDALLGRVRRNDGRTGGRGDHDLAPAEPVGVVPVGVRHLDRPDPRPAGRRRRARSRGAWSGGRRRRPGRQARARAPSARRAMPATVSERPSRSAPASSRP